MHIYTHYHTYIYIYLKRGRCVYIYIYIFILKIYRKLLGNGFWVLSEPRMLTYVVRSESTPGMKFSSPEPGPGPGQARGPGRGVGARSPSKGARAGGPRRPRGAGGESGGACVVCISCPLANTVIPSDELPCGGAGARRRLAEMSCAPAAAEIGASSCQR